MLLKEDPRKEEVDNKDGEPELLTETFPGDFVLDEGFEFFVPGEASKETVPEWVVEGSWERPFFDDHMYPFDLVATVKDVADQPGSVKWCRYMSWLCSGPSLLVATSGRVPEPPPRTLIKQGIEAVLGEGKFRKMRDWDAKSTWVVVEVDSEESVQTLVGKGMVYRTEGPNLVIFRAISKIALQSRVISFIRIPLDKPLEVIKAVAELYPPANPANALPYTTLSRKKPDSPEATLDINVRITLPSAEAAKAFQRPPKIGVWKVRGKPPHCTICHAEDHVKEQCWWMGDLGAKGVLWRGRSFSAR